VREASDPTVLVVDDDGGIRAALQRALALDGFAVAVADGGASALAAVAADPPQLIVLDVAMPEIDGIAVTKRLRGRGIDVPICMLSARDEVADRVAGLRAGADDYLVKPFAVEELSARLHALLRRRGVVSHQPLRVGELVVDPRQHEASLGGRPLELTLREFALLEAFAVHPGQVLSRDQLLELVWGYMFPVETNVVDVFVGYLRRKLEADGEARMLHTVRGAGYVLRA
jgi:two-component system response regulator PrrA